jgi:hypothetical protein
MSLGCRQRRGEDLHVEGEVEPISPGRGIGHHPSARIDPGRTNGVHTRTVPSSPLLMIRVPSGDAATVRALRYGR